MAKKDKKIALKEVVEELESEDVEVEIVNEPVVKESPRLFEAPRKRR
tara:strand:+ start:98 stop:238 length:141 start_codon:yes stop_codon:yes gene_type:complete